MSTAKDVVLFKQKAAAHQAQLDIFAKYVDLYNDVDQLKMRMKSAEETWEAYANLFDKNVNNDSNDYIEFKRESDKYFETLYKAQRILESRTWINSWFEYVAHNVYYTFKYFVYFTLVSLVLDKLLKQDIEALKRGSI